jgi:hypothetical protein
MLRLPSMHPSSHSKGRIPAADSWRISPITRYRVEYFITATIVLRAAWSVSKFHAWC